MVGRPGRRRGLRRGDPVSTTPDQAQEGYDAGSATPRSPRNGSLQELADSAGTPVSELLREVAEFRLALETDLTIAAAAADVSAGELSPDRAAEIVSSTLAGGRADLRELEGRLLEGLDRPAAIRVPRPRRFGGRTGSAASAPPPRPRARVRAVPLIVAGVVVGLMAGLVGPTVHPATSSAPGVTLSADESFASLSQAVGAGDSTEAASAGDALHETVAALIARAPDDPQAAREAARLLIAEGLFLDRLPGPEGVRLQARMRVLIGRLTAAVGQPLRVIAGPPLAAPARPGSPIPAVPTLVLPSLPLSLPSRPPLPVNLPQLPALPTATASSTRPAQTSQTPSGPASQQPSAQPTPGRPAPSQSASASASASEQPPTSQPGASVSPAPTPTIGLPGVQPSGTVDLGS